MIIDNKFENLIPRSPTKGEITLFTTGEMRGEITSEKISSK
jgi:hypothetical protein